MVKAFASIFVCITYFTLLFLRTLILVLFLAVISRQPSVLLSGYANTVDLFIILCENNLDMHKAFKDLTKTTQNCTQPLSHSEW